MGKIEIDHTGSGGGITLSSDGTDLLLGGTAIGGSALELYVENPSTPTTPLAGGTNGVAIGSSTNAGGVSSIALGSGSAAGDYAFAVQIGGGSTSYGAVGNYSIAMGQSARASDTNATSIGYLAWAQASESTSIGPYTDAGSYRSTAIGYNAQGYGTNAVALANSRAGGTDSFAAAIANNTSSYGATGSNSIAMGYQADAFNTYSVAIGRSAIAGGDTALALGEARANGVRSIAIGTTISSGKGASGIYAIAIGYNSASTGTGSVCLGPENTSSSQYAVAIGRYASSAVEGKLAYAAGRFAAAGDAQGGQFILRADTTDATATVLTTNNSTAGSTNQIVAASDTCITFDGTITAMQNGAQAYASWKIEGLLVNDGGTTTLANSATTVISNADGWGMALSADNTNNALAITVTGEAAHNIRWVANIRTTEVTYA